MKTLTRIVTVITFCCGIYVQAQSETSVDKSFTKEITKLKKNKKVQSAMQVIDAYEQETIEQMIVLNEIPAPPFKESARAEKFKQMFLEIGLDSVWIDAEGNVLALQKGSSNGKTVALDAHIDTVFPEETDVTVKVEGNTYTAPGIGDNSRAMALVLAVAKAIKQSNIKTNADIVFVGTVGEEGPGDLRGVKHLFSEESDLKIDSWIAVDGGSPGRIINGALGSKRYRAIFKGKGGHSWGAFGLANPHHALGKAIDIFTKEASDLILQMEEKTIFNVGRIGGGTSINSIPFESWLEVDMRSLSPKNLIQIDSVFRHSMQKAVDIYNDTNVKDKVWLELKKIGDRPSGELSKDTPLVQKALAAANGVGLAPVLKTSSTNSNIPISLGIPAVTLSRGGKTTGAHSLDEKWINSDGDKNIKLALLLLLAEAGLR
ncbi:M20/M25/M40 family metallo-hydrolase [Flagellimonas sp. HMM57]|uniref:M20/M25/M40 family metallo-hydrolase n=1 Tax=unclassified Flagellimonas TaxID=2644544 RepID=UPI0013D5218B|nr:MULTISPECIES: M20/M25/M40 family metallo-hydrolase [unclassified Flagellimonas]UII76184.1 M20/M25/M40 family metallo-hydrolase [Flagellimonas sp. HMM57]